ncbi:FAS1 domain containing protein [Trema orientale]|uniref:FAS1 domain containing protein n=1 Tax=Trema orientale TaxID=63057 RepID=A0A2P5FNC4_TREOI|nr:FAS1 domain containing protein [Trema orientale]
MAKILERNLNSDIHPYCGDFLFFVDRRNRFTIYGNNTVTLFVPPDEAIRFEKWIDLRYQIVMAKVDVEAFESAGSLSKGSKLESSTQSKQRLVVDQVFDNGTVSINNVKITKWNIYNDGHVIVHGTEDFFNHFQGA